MKIGTVMCAQQQASCVRRRPLILKRLAPEIAQTVDEIDGKFAALIDELAKIEATHEAHARAWPTLAPPREVNGDEVLAAMARMTPEMCAALLNKLKQ